MSDITEYQPKLKTSHIYIGMIIIFLFTLILYPGGKFEWNTNPALVGVILLAFMAVDQGWKNFKMHGKACITNLEKNFGGHSTIHPDDMSIARGKDDELTFMVLAQGGFVYSGIEWQGQDRFLVFPPEHAEKKRGGIVIHTKLRRVDLDDLPDYVQSELMQLKWFNPRKVHLRKNLYFGSTCEKFMTDTEENFKAESKFLDQTSQLNYYKRIIQDLTKKATPPPWVEKEEEK